MYQKMYQFIYQTFNNYFFFNKYLLFVKTLPHAFKDNMLAYPNTNID